MVLSGCEGGLMLECGLNGLTCLFFHCIRMKSHYATESSSSRVKGQGALVGLRLSAVAPL